MKLKTTFLLGCLLFRVRLEVGLKVELAVVCEI